MEGNIRRKILSPGASSFSFNPSTGPEILVSSKNNSKPFFLNSKTSKTRNIYNKEFDKILRLAKTFWSSYFDGTIFTYCLNQPQKLYLHDRLGRIYHAFDTSNKATFSIFPFIRKTNSYSPLF